MIFEMIFKFSFLFQSGADPGFSRGGGGGGGFSKKF